MKKITLILVFVCASCYAQKTKSTKMGKATLSELTLKRYEKDSTANALVLYEHANVYMEQKKYNIQTDYYYRVKIFNKKGEDNATIKFRTYGKKVKNVKGITYNLGNDGKTIVRTTLQVKDVFRNKLHKKWNEVSFTLPNIKEGSVIEYSYSTISPSLDLEDWYFQSDIPKLQSDYDSALIGNYAYNIRMTGKQKLSKNNPSILKKCIYIDGLGKASCTVRSFSMVDVPAFKEEKYMLSEDNFISRLSFDLESYTNGRGEKKRYLDSWKIADKRLKNDFLNNQTTKKKYFKKRVPPAFLSISNQLEKATKIYEYIRDSYSWNGKNWISADIQVKKTFQEKSGSVDAINLALYNSLQALNIESYIVMLATRDRAIPTKLYPILFDFNYLIVKVVINGKEYFLDATNKLLPFGVIPFKCLNGDVRVMDFKKGSYWQSLTSVIRTRRSTKIMLKLNNEGELKGNVLISNSGYFGIDRRKKIGNVKDEKHLEDFESENINLEVEDYKKINFDKLNKATKEVYKVNYIDDEPTTSIDHIKVSPFFIERFTENPFKSEKRDYPVDYGFPRRYVYNFTLEIPKNYIVKKVPEDLRLGLPGKGGTFILKTNTTENSVNIYFSFSINKKLYSSEEYYYLKEMYKEVIKAQSSFIELEKS